MSKTVVCHSAVPDGVRIGVKPSKLPEALPGDISLLFSNGEIRQPKPERNLCNATSGTHDCMLSWWALGNHLKGSSCQYVVQMRNQAKDPGSRHGSIVEGRMCVSKPIEHVSIVIGRV